MNIGAIYECVVREGLKKDPRTRKELEQARARVRREYAKLKGDDKKCFEKEKLRHPYGDTRILYGDRKKTVRTMMVGIDVDAEELLTAYLLNEKGAGIDLAVSHHPSGIALSNLDRVMGVHTDILRHLGVKREISETIMKERVGEVSRRLHARNMERNVDIARVLDMPFMCVHTPADNHVTHYLTDLFRKRKPSKVRDVLRMLKAIPEYRDAMTKNVGPRLIAGKEKDKAGRIFVDMTGGTEGSKKAFARLSQAGVGTIVAMHLSEEHFKVAKSEFINVIIAGHIASDTLGLNLVLDRLSKEFPFNVFPCSGFTRVRRGGGRQ
jgi:hypothetical protein